MSTSFSYSFFRLLPVRSNYRRHSMFFRLTLLIWLLWKCSQDTLGENYILSRLLREQFCIVIYDKEGSCLIYTEERLVLLVALRYDRKGRATMMSSVSWLSEMLRVIRLRGRQPRGSSVMRLLLTVSYFRFGGRSVSTEESSWLDEMLSFYRLEERQLVLRELNWFYERLSETKLEKFNSYI